MGGKTLKFDDIEVNKKKFMLKSKSKDTSKIVISDKFKHSDNGFKHFIGYKGDNIFRPLFIILP